ncbi:hypothetical protein GCM10027610_076230 [Dactylosporangium cerinum]
MTFDKRTGTLGNTTQTIYVGVADKQNTVYRTTNGGTSWERVAGQPTGYLSHKGVLDTAGGNLYVATSDTGGPYDGAKGDVWKYNTATGVWTQISPVPSSSSDDYFGYNGLTIDRQHPNTIMVATQISWWPDVIFFRSTDAGATWTRIWDFTSYPNRSFRYKMDVSRSPWLSLGANPQPPEVSPKLGWMTESLEIDPFNSNRFMYGTGATIYGSTDLTTWDTGGQITIKPMAAGLEETAVLDLISPPSGAPLISGLGDIGGFRHTNLDAVPAMMFQSPYFTSTTSLDYAELNPSVMARAGNFADSDRPNDSHAAFSTDGGANWFQGSEPGGINEGGTIAAAADGSRFVWAPKNSAPVYSVGFGNTWTAASGLPQNAVVESDRVLSSNFYGFSGGTFYRSTNGGATFAAGATGLPATATFKAVPGVAGEIWLAGAPPGSSDRPTVAFPSQRWRRYRQRTPWASARARPAARTSRSSPWRRSTGRRACTAPTTAPRPGCASTTTSTSTATSATRSRVTRVSTAGCTSAPTAAASSTATAPAPRRRRSPHHRRVRPRRRPRPHGLLHRRPRRRPRRLPRRLPRRPARLATRSPASGAAPSRER